MRAYIRPSLQSRVVVFSGESAPDEPQIVLSASSIAEDAAVGSLVGILSVAHSEDVFTFSITSDPDTKFVLDLGDNTRLETEAALDYETATSHNVTISADNGVDTPITQVFTITVTDVAEGGGESASLYWFLPTWREEAA